MRRLVHSREVSIFFKWTVILGIFESYPAFLKSPEFMALSTQPLHSFNETTLSDQTDILPPDLFKPWPDFGLYTCKAFN